ncbi:MAG: hypothetical protein K2Q12_06280, partial [Rickettsiales bacterium]|nr:hypothetical protein [Rickettsiales bacterium]
NFHHEPPVVANICSFIPDQSSIFPNLAERLFKTILISRIGRGITYCQGVSPRAKPYYDSILRMAGDQYTPMILALLTHYEIQSLLSRSICRTQAKEALEMVKQNVINERLLECLNYLIAKIEESQSCTNSAEFRKLSAQYIQWP